MPTSMASMVARKVLGKVSQAASVRQMSSGSSARLGAREKLLLEDDASLAQFRPQRQVLSSIKRVGDVFRVFAISIAVFEIGYKYSTAKP